jgi:serine phosphatase RsbU (regulator of sigma subunit)
MRLFAPPAASPADVDVHGVSLPARAFTGDFYYSRRQGDTLWIVLGDVAGKGLNAAVVMAMIQEELEHRITSCSRSECDPAITMARLDAFLRPLLPPNRFATGVIAQLHDSGRLRLVNAGHPPALIARADGSIQEVASTGPPAGLLNQARWTSATLQLGRGETLLLYSDGAIESVKAGEEFGVCGLKMAFASAAGSASARGVATSLIEALDCHEKNDDLTLFVARR